MAIVDSCIFENFILFFILASCIFLTFDPETDPDSKLGQAMEFSEYIFMVVFTLEFILKIVAFGAFTNGPKSYFRDVWNILDFVVVISSFMSLDPSLNDLSLIRCLRVFRALKAAKNVAGMKMIMEAIASSLPGLVDVLLLAFVTFTFLSVVGMQLMGGTFGWRCAYVLGNETSNETFPDMDMMCNLDAGNGCPDDMICMDTGQNPNNGITAFDNLGVSWASIIICISLEGWSDIMDYGQETGAGAVGVIFFVLVVAVGAFFYR
jgi:voltage-dependent calcium channel L type alpha-1D